MKQILIVFLTLLSLSHYGNASLLGRDDFTQALDGWTGSGISTYHSTATNRDYMRIARDTTSTKTYDFGMSYANMEINITIQLYPYTGWENSGYYTDYFNIFNDTTRIGQLTYPGDGLYITTTTTTLDDNGKIKLLLNPDTTANVEIMYIDYIEINTNTTAGIPPVANAGADQDLANGSSVHLTASASYDTDGSITSYVWSENGSQVATGENPTITLTSGTHTITLTITDNEGNTDSDTVTIVMRAVAALDALNDSYTTNIDVAAEGDLFDNDIGYGIYVTSNTDPSNGTVNVTSGGYFVYTPNVGYQGTDSFTYTIIGAGGTDTATVTITITNTINIQTSSQIFQIINPPSTRNILGNYVILGNTLECATNSTTAYTGTCQDDSSLNNNAIMTKYIDIDNNTSTWNSSSSNFTLPDTNNEQGIAWAGLFWQGAINNLQTSNNQNDTQRRAFLSNGAVNFLNISGSTTTTVNISTSNARNILLKLDNSNYTPIGANTLYIDNRFGTSGGFYAAYTDITQLIRNQNPSVGTHTITIANLTANEGKQSSYGNYAGWSIVIIYREQGDSVKARNISIYNGYDALDQSTNPSTDITIAGFRLPSTGDVEAKFSAFSGEGEFVYGDGTNSNGNADFDRMVMKSTINGTESTMPGAIDSDNIFDARLANISRDSGNNNALQNNNNGIDIDDYDVSSIMTGYRNTDKNISSIVVGLSTNHDYITPSMLAFSADLYKPDLCYDYSIKQNKFDITDINSTEIHTIGTGDLSINIAIQSEDGDFDFENAKLSINLASGGVQFDHALYAPNNVNTLIPATYIETPPSPLIAIGENVTPVGGTIRKRQRYFAEFDYKLTSARYDGDFDIDFNATIDFGSGGVPIMSSTSNGTLKRCSLDPVYRPVKGQYNIERHASTGNNDYEKYPLYTQVVGKDFDFDLVAYEEGNGDYKTEYALDGYTVDIELISANSYNDENASFLCNNPDPKIIQNLNSSGKTNIFAKFENDTRVDLSGLDIRTDTALRNATFRMWYLVDTNGSLIKHDCPSPEEDEAASNTCFQTLYDNNISAEDKTVVQPNNTVGFCSADTISGGCSGYTNAETGKSGCYACLRDFFAQALCARDNFAIRPAAYRLELYDTNETNSSNITPKLLEKNTNTSAQSTLAAGYKYHLTGITTVYGSDTKALGYRRTFKAPSDSKLSSILVNKNSAPCVDQNNTDWGMHFNNGEIIGTVDINDTNLSSINLNAGNLVKYSNVGKYEYYIHDENWTKVDQKDYKFKPFREVDDCVVGSNIIDVGATEMPGCNTDSNLTDTVNGAVYENLNFSFVPYKFKLDVNISKPVGGDMAYIYMNDFENTFYNNPNDRLGNPYNMSIAFIGHIVALAKDNNITTNFISGCVAASLPLHLERTTSPISEANLVDIQGSQVFFQQYLANGSGTIETNNTLTAMDGNTTIGSTWFDGNASASIQLDTNIKKPLDRSDLAVNPIRIWYRNLEVMAEDLNSSADMGTHTPSAKKVYDQNVTAYYSRIIASKDHYDNVPIGNILTPSLYADIYCDTDGTTNCLNDFNLTENNKTHSSVDKFYWYRTTNLYNPLIDGTVELTTNNSITIQKRQNIEGTISLNNTVPGEQKDINITGFSAVGTFQIAIHPMVPWHYSAGANLADDGTHFGDFNPNIINGNIINVAGGNWSGVGNTGQTAGTQSSQNSPRMNW